MRKRSNRVAQLGEESEPMRILATQSSSLRLRFEWTKLVKADWVLRQLTLVSGGRRTDEPFGLPGTICTLSASAECLRIQ